MPLTFEDILTLKEPFGVLIKDEDATKEKIKGLLKDAKKVVSIGDSTTDRLIFFDILPDVSVVDNRERRLKLKTSLHSKINVHELHCANPAGTISREAVSVLHKALRISAPVKVIVYGEEDMLALPVIAFAPYRTLVLYGQPLEGLVVVTVTAKMRRKAKDIMDRIGMS
jgi:GTP-dependent dephospho-CoA kinase